MAISVLDNPVLFGMRLGAELDQLRQGAMAQAITQSLREALDLHTWRYGMLANLLAAYHRAQSPEEKGAYAQFIDALVKTATYPHQGTPVVSGVAVSIPYLWREFSVGGLPSDAEQQSSPQPQEQQGDAVQSNQQQPVGQPAESTASPNQSQPVGHQYAEQQIPAPMLYVRMVQDHALPWYPLLKYHPKVPKSLGRIFQIDSEGEGAPFRYSP